MPLFLSGPAFAVYKQLSDGERDDYDKLKAALLEAFGTNSFAAYEQLQQRSLREGETVDVYLSDIRRLVVLMGQKDADPLIKCAFMAGLPTAISVQLKSMAAVEKLDLSSLISRTRMMLSTRNSDSMCAAGWSQSQPRSNCYTCGGYGHSARACPTDCRPRQYTGIQTRRRTCYTCGKPDHFARDCPSKADIKTQSGNGKGGTLAPEVSPLLR